MADVDALERAQRENRVMADLARLAMSNQPYMDVVRSVMDHIEQLVVSPLLSLSIRESEHIGHYARGAPDVDEAWSEETGHAIADIHGRLLHQSTPAPHSGAVHHAEGPSAWLTTFLSRTRSGWGCALTLASLQAVALTPEEEHLMLRLTDQILLVLDRALLLAQVDGLETVDRLTGVANQRRFLDILDYEIGRHRYLDRLLALIVLDIEGLKNINLHYGRRYGNHILKRLADVLQKEVRPIDVVARCGLDEFAVMLPETDVEDAQRIAETLRDRASDVVFAGGDVELSLGVAHINPDEVLSPENFLRRGEQALQGAKRQQRAWSARPEAQRLQIR